MSIPGEIPLLTAPQMAEVDRLMIEEFQISLIQMMEVAGRSLADLTSRLSGGQVENRSIAILCGKGNNGGGGLVAARHLYNWGVDVSLTLAHDQTQLKGTPHHQLQILNRMGIPTTENPNLESADMIIDALIGYGLRGDPRQPIAAWIERANQSGRTILALDAPSGLDTTSGVPGIPCIKASATITLALPKTGLMTAQAQPYVGDLYLADIGVPAGLYLKLGIHLPNMFINDTIIKIG